MIYLTRKEHFNAAHKLYCENWSEEKNFEVFEKCANKNWHGHNYELFVTAKGLPDKTTGFVVNAKELSEVIKNEICEKLDHKNLNLDVNLGSNIQPSTENLTIWIWNILVKKLSNCELHSVKLKETENIWVEYFGN